MPADVKIKDHERLLWGMARKAHRRCYAAGAQSVLVEDLFQEASIAWCRARDLWKPEFEVPFEPYLIRGVSHHLNRFIANELKERQAVGVDLDASEGDGEGNALHDIVPDKAPRPDEVVIERDVFDYLRDPMRWRNRVRKVSERTVQFLEFVAKPPPELFDAIAGLEIRAEYARERGVPGAAVPTFLTNWLIFDLMGCSRLERLKISKEVKALCAELSQQ